MRFFLNLLEINKENDESDLVPWCTRHQMIAHDGLASFACDTGPAVLLAGVALAMDLLACYFMITEARVGVELT